jgi:hypothetical protein
MTRITILNKVDYSLSTTNYMSDMINTSHFPVAINNPGYFPNTVPPALFSEY